MSDNISVVSLYFTKEIALTKQIDSLLENT